jgi:hypothetical protein
MLRALLFLLLATTAFAADAIKIRVVGSPIEGSPVSAELKPGSDILDAVALVGGMTLSSSHRVHLTRKGESRSIDLVAALGALESPVLLEDGDVVGVGEHVMSLLPWEAFNALLFECVYRRSQGLPMTDGWKRKLSKLAAPRKMADKALQ